MVTLVPYNSKTTARLDSFQKGHADGAAASAILDNLQLQNGTHCAVGWLLKVQCT